MQYLTWKPEKSIVWNQSQAELNICGSFDSKDATSLKRLSVSKAAQFMTILADLKFIYSEKATTFCEISTFYLTGTT